MRTRILWAVAGLLVAAPVFAQSSKDVTGPRKLTPAMVMCTDLPITTKPVPRMAIAGIVSTDGRHASSAGGNVIIKRAPDDGLAIGQRFIAQRLHGDPKAFPRPGEGFGDLRLTGWVIIRALDDINALAEVEFACDSVEDGDFLEPFVAASLPTSATAMLDPDFSDRATVIFGADNRVVFGDGDIASINRGTAHGVVTGARYALYRDRHDHMPLVHIGEAVVLAASETTSKVMVTRSSDAIESGDTAVPRRMP
jgi:hypothetical protein